MPTTIHITDQGDQNISGVKTFQKSQVNITGSSLNFGHIVELGAPVTFTQDNNTEVQVIDIIDTNVQITRGSHQGIYNPDQEGEWNGSGPSYTEWNADGWSDLTNLSSRTYYDLYYVPQFYGQIGYHIVDQELIMHDTFNDKYYKFYFTNWMQGGSTSWQNYNDQTPPITYAGFEYTRTRIISASSAEINGSNIGGYLDLKNRLFINGTGVLLSGEAGQVPNTVVQTSGTQTISGSKTFTAATTFSAATFNSGVNFNNNITVGRTGIFSSMDVSVDEMSISGLNLTVTNGTGIFNNGIDLNNSTIINAAPQIINVSSNFIISGDYNSRMIMANSSSTITGRIVSGNATGFNVSIIQVGTAQIQITGSGNGISIGSFASAYKTAGQYATISLLHTGNNRYIMYGNTA